MWPNKKSHVPQTADPEPKNWQSNEPPKPAPSEGTAKTNKDVIPPAGGTAVPSRLGSSLHLKSEISGNEDLDIGGTVEGLVDIDEGKLTVGVTAKLTADVIAGEVIVYGSREEYAHERRGTKLRGRRRPGSVLRGILTA